jgi:hypothetical protein
LALADVSAQQASNRKAENLPMMVAIVLLLAGGNPVFLLCPADYNSA